MSTNRQRCFVIMPFTKTSAEHTEDYWTKHFDSFLKPLIEQCPQLEAHRSEPLRGDILRQIITELVVCPVVVADLTDTNPNVYWELGVRQSFKHSTITIAEAGTELPFDIGAKGTLFYHPKDHLKNAEFCRFFRVAVEDCLANPDRPDSHVLETISGRGTLFQILQRDETVRRLDAVLSECDSNLELQDSYVESAKSNQERRSAKEKAGVGKKEEKLTFPSLLLRTTALELLVAHRYVDEGPEFYETAEDVLGFIVAVNSQVWVWAQYSDSIEKWVLANQTATLGRLKTLKKQVEDARAKMSKVL